MKFLELLAGEMLFGTVHAKSPSASGFERWCSMIVGHCLLVRVMVWLLSWFLWWNLGIVLFT